jgi:hypothetical protein
VEAGGQGLLRRRAHTTISGASREPSCMMLHAVLRRRLWWPIDLKGKQLPALLRRLRWPLIGLLSAGLVLLILLALVTVPPLVLGADQVGDFRQIQDPARRLDEVNGLRTTLAGILGGLAVAGGAIVAALNFRETSRQNRAVLELQRRGQVTERFTRAIDQLGQRSDDKLDVRIGAVYALEQIARDSADLHWPIMEVLTAYLREHAPVPTPPEADDALVRRPAADHHAVTTVLGRRVAAQDRGALDLHVTDLHGADLRGANLRESVLMGSNLRGASLYGADLRSALLIGRTYVRRSWFGQICEKPT